MRRPTARRVIFSAHGVPKSVPAEAAAPALFYLDATCPLVSKVHVEAERHFRAGRDNRADRPCGPSRSDGTIGQAAGRRDRCWSKTLADVPKASSPAIRRTSPTSRRRPYRSTTPSDIVDTPAPPLSADRRVRTRTTSATPRPIAKARSRRSSPRSDHVLVIGAPNSSNSRAWSKWRSAPARAPRR